MKYIIGNIILALLAWLYQCITGLRNRLFDMNILKSVEFDFPVICIGNLSAGGTGKTPFTAFIAGFLLPEYRVAVLSRGYKRKTKGFQLADDKSDALTIGDEPFELKRKFAGLCVAVDEKRVRGIEKLQEIRSDIQVVLLDDAFQHRAVNAGLNILLTDYNRLFTNDYQLPYGMLRESRKGYKRADIIVVTKCPETISENEISDIRNKIKPLEGQEIYFAGLMYSDIYQMFNTDVRLTSEEFQDREIILMTGIVSPEQAMNYLTGNGAKVELMQFPDHHFFTEGDYRKLMNKADDKIIIITEKDAARIVNDKNFPAELKEKIYVLPVRITILQNREQHLITKIKNYVTAN